MIGILLLPIVYLLVALLLTEISVNHNTTSSPTNKIIYLTTNGIHLDIIIPIHNIDSNLLKEIEGTSNSKFIAFGWGDENFYLNTPTWSDLTIKNAVSALFLKSSTLMHVTKYSQTQKHWTPIKLSELQMTTINEQIDSAFQRDSNGIVQLLPNEGYFSNDDFYKANGSYSCLNTCNSWVNSTFKVSGVKACMWTPFDYGLLKLHTHSSE